jgi:hypothetical protein
MTMGSHDVVVIMQAPDDGAVARMARRRSASAATADRLGEQGCGSRVSRNRPGSGPLDRRQPMRFGCVGLFRPFGRTLNIWRGR